MSLAIACLTLDAPDDFVIDDPLMHAELRARGHQVTEVPWRSGPRWDDFDLVIIRTPWDYQQAPQAFLDVLATIDASSASLANSLAVVRWNLSKRYLLDLAQAGVPIVPTRWHDPGATPGDIAAAFRAFDCDELVIKPQVSANADHTYRLAQASWGDQSEQLTAVFASRACMIQPFLRSVTELGEWSLFYFGGQYSHAIRKCPKAGDFRVQEEHGAEILADEPPGVLQALAERALAQAPSKLLYARVDFLMDQGQQPRLIELELIEPSLYFRMQRDAAHRFADAVDRWPVVSSSRRMG